MQIEYAINATIFNINHGQKMQKLISITLCHLLSAEKNRLKNAKIVELTRIYDGSSSDKILCSPLWQNELFLQILFGHFASMKNPLI